MAFILAMGIHQDVQHRLQRDLDSLIGRKRLPTPLDVKSSPYLQAVFLEVLRWFPVDPLGVPRRTMVDCEYEGYFIPRGTTVIAVRECLP